MKYIFIALDRVLYTLLITVLAPIFLVASIITLIILFLYDFKINEEGVRVIKSIPKDLKKSYSFKIGISDFSIKQ